MKLMNRRAPRHCEAEGRKHLYVWALVTVLYALLCLPLYAEQITFSANAMTGTAGSSSDTTVLKGNSYVLTSSIEITADSVTMSGDNFRYIDAQGEVSGKNMDSNLDIKCQSVHYDRKTQVSTLTGSVSLSDKDNGVDVNAEIVEYDQETDVATIQINAEIRQKNNVCKGAFAVYHKREQVLELNGNAQITQGEDTFNAQTITLNLDTQEITLDGQVKGSVSDNGG